MLSSFYLRNGFALCLVQCTAHQRPLRPCSLQLYLGEPVYVGAARKTLHWAPQGPYMEPYIRDLMFTVFPIIVTGIMGPSSQVVWHVSVLTFVLSQGKGAFPLVLMPRCFSDFEIPSPPLPSPPLSFPFLKQSKLKARVFTRPTFTLAHVHSDCSFKWKKKGMELPQAPRELR